MSVNDGGEKKEKTGGGGGGWTKGCGGTPKKCLAKRLSDTIIFSGVKRPGGGVTGKIISNVGVSREKTEGQCHK